MKEIKVLPKLTKKYILERISQLQIFEYYTGYVIEENVMYPAPENLRHDDTRPSIGFKYGAGGKLRMKDFGGYFWGDCFDYVAFLLHENANTKKGFFKAMDRIARDFHIHKYDTTCKFKEPLIRNQIVKEEPKIKTFQDISFTTRLWYEVDVNYWGSRNFSSEELDYLRIRPVQFAWLNQNQFYSFKPSDPCYAYDFNNDQSDVKLYFPLRDRYRFIANRKNVHRFDIVQPAKVGILIKSYKDVGVLRKIKIFGEPVQSLSIAGETIIPREDEIQRMKQNFDYLFSLMDFDRTGITMACKLRRKFGIQPLFLTNGKFNSHDYGAKDPDAYALKFGYDALQELSYKLEDYIEQQEALYDLYNTY